MYCTIIMKTVPISTRLFAIGNKVGKDAYPANVLRVASTSGYLVSLGEGFQEELAKAYPNMKLEVTEGDDQRVFELLGTGSFDCGFAMGPIDSLRCYLITQKGTVLSSEVTAFRSFMLSRM